MSRIASCMVALLVVALTALDARARPILTDAGANAWWLVAERAPIRSQFITTPQPWGDVQRLDLDRGIWTQVIPVTRQPVSIANVDDRLAILFDDGTWFFAWPGTLMEGARLPARLHPLAIASDGSTLWFLARSGLLPVAASEADYFNADSQSTDQLWLVSYSAAKFSDPILLTDESAQPGQSNFSIVRFAQGELALVRRDVDGNINWWRWSNAAGLKALSPGDSKVEWARAVAGFGKPAYFAITADHQARIVFDQNSFITIQCDPMFVDPSTDLSVVRGEIRLVRIHQDRIHTQTFSLEGAAKSKAAILPVGSTAQGGGWLLRFVLMGSLLPVLLWSFGQPPNSGLELTVRPAPLYLRALASLIDMPFLLPGPVFLLLAWITNRAPWNSPDAQTYFVLMAFSVAAYLFYTTVFEVVMGRTPGKMLLGLRVVRPDGSKPEPARLIVRNLPRVIEFVFFPLLLTIFMPARQRMGDLIANTVVVRDSTVPGESGNQSRPTKDGQA